MLLEQAELPGDEWVMRDERSWRTGSMGNPTEAARRAHRAGAFTAWRSFEETEPSRWLWIEVVSFVTATDAEWAVPKFLTGGMPNPKAEVTVTEERTIEDREIPGVVNPWVYEQLTMGTRGSGTARYVIGNVDHVLFAVACSGLADRWPWNEVALIAASQSEKIRFAKGKDNKVGLRPMTG